MSNQVSKIEKRLARPQTIGSAFGGLMKMFGGRASDADLLKRWSEIMGDDIASVAKLVGITKTRDKKINIAVKSSNPAFALQLSYQTDEIINRINKYFGYNAVNKITIRK
ncbi:MAG: DUF721 domain-containing protein [Alphaproteobacteria bacterium]|nr:DUF721 domain-containing protein [Alphaproteobacteria bacterium]MBN2675602.1 DUF721 domain-containing protein [Alphaproteobacteria bacterium]